MFFRICFLILFFTSGPLGFTESVVLAGQAQALSHNTRVALQGNIIFGLGGDRFIFRDSSGDMVVKIESNRWGGLYIGPLDRIEINGVLKRDDRAGRIELDVSSIRRATGAQGRRAQELEYMFIWPVSGRITSLYGNRRSPFTGRQEFHTGIDIGAPTGTPVRAAMSGRVSVVSRNNVYGNYILINHHSGLRTKYAHLSATRVRTGAYVQTNERIGDVGNTGRSTGSHLHFGVFRNGVMVNPRGFLR